MTPRRGCIIGLSIALLVWLIAPPARAEGDAGALRAIEFTSRTIYHSPQTPGYTAWCTLWRTPEGRLRLAFQQVTGPVQPLEQRKNVTVILDGSPDAAEWKPIREVPARNEPPIGGKIYPMPASSSFCGHGMACLSGNVLVTGLWAGGGITTGYIQRSEDGGETWSAPIFPLPADRYKTYSTTVHALRDGKLVLVCGVLDRSAGRQNLAHIRKAMFESQDGGRTWGEPIWLMPLDAGACEESDFVELDGGDLLFVHRAEHYGPDGKYLRSDRLQSVVRRTPLGWEPGPATKAAFPHSGFPELLKTREGAILHIATNGIWATRDAGQSWQKLEGAPGSPYYPRATQLDDGRILVVGHIGSDDAYGSVDQSIVQQTFRLAAR